MDRAGRPPGTSYTHTGCLSHLSSGTYTAGYVDNLARQTQRYSGSKLKADSSIGDFGKNVGWKEVKNNILEKLSLL